MSEKVDLSKVIELCDQLNKELENVMTGEHPCSSYVLNDKEYESLDSVIVNLEEILECNEESPDKEIEE